MGFALTAAAAAVVAGGLRGRRTTTPHSPAFFVAHQQRPVIQEKVESPVKRSGNPAPFQDLMSQD